MTTKKRKTALTAAVMALAALSCAKEVDDAAPSVAGAAQAERAVPAASAAPQAAAPAAAPDTPTAVRARVRQSRYGLAPAIEVASAPPSQAVLDAVAAQRQKLSGAVAGVPGASVRFIDCSGAAACTSRLEAKTITGLRDLLQAVSKEQGGISFVAREQLDAYAGQTFVADVTLGGEGTRPVPTDENELLGP